MALRPNSIELIKLTCELNKQKNVVNSNQIKHDKSTGQRKNKTKKKNKKNMNKLYEN